MSSIQGPGGAGKPPPGEVGAKEPDPAAYQNAIDDAEKHGGGPAEHQFFKGFKMNKKEYKMFMRNLLSFVSTQMKQEAKQMKKVSRRMRKAYQ